MSQLLSIFNKLTSDNIADYYKSLYWFCKHNHEGQFSVLYSILSTLQYKPSLTETSDDCDYDILFDLDNQTLDASLLATALRLWSVVEREAGDNKDRVFVKLHYVDHLDIYLAEYHDHDEVGYETYFLVYSISSAGTIVNQTLPE